MPRDTNLAVEAPRGRAHQTRLGPVATAGNDLNSTVVQAYTDGVLDSVLYLPDTAITGANTNSRTLNLVNLSNSNVVMATLALVTGVNAAVATGIALTLSGTAANLNVTAGDVLQWQSVHVGTGIADPGGLAVITLGAT